MTLPRGGDTIHRVDVNILIIDDEITEQQQILVGYIEIAAAVDTDNIVLGRTATMLIINDDDASMFK